MAIMEILTYPDTRLAQKSLAVTSFDASLKALCADMLETMYAANGIGLAAPQVDVHKLVVVLDVDFETSDDEAKTITNKNPRVFINPKITKREGSVISQEGCLSVPGEYEDVGRAERIQVEFQDETGKSHTLEADGMLAICLQHELDHLDGRLFIDRLSFVKRKSIKRKILKELQE